MNGLGVSMADFQALQRAYDQLAHLLTDARASLTVSRDEADRFERQLGAVLADNGVLLEDMAALDMQRIDLTDLLESARAMVCLLEQQNAAALALHVHEEAGTIFAYCSVCYKRRRHRCPPLAMPDRSGSH